MSSVEQTHGTIGAQTSRRSTREKKKTQHFGHSEPSQELQELIDGPKVRKAAPDLLKESESVTQKPSLIVKLSLPSLKRPQPCSSKTLQSGEAVKIQGKNDSKAQEQASSLGNQKRKRGAAQNDNDETDCIPSSSQGPAPKKQRTSQTGSQPRAVAKTNTVIHSEHDHRPEPRGAPEVWAEMRQALCESLPYYQAYQSGAYTWGSSNGFPGWAYGFLLDNDNDEYGYMDEKVVVTKFGGGMKVNNESGKREQTEDQSSTSNKVAPFLNNRKDQVPLILIVGAKNPHCPTKVPHRYNVLGYYQVTDIWSEKVNGKVVCRVRFEMIDLKTPSWWGIRGSPLPASRPDYVTKAPLKTCPTCGISGKQVFTAGWTCLNEACKDFSTIVNGKSPIGAQAWNPAFINERTKWPAHNIIPNPVKPNLPVKKSDGSLAETSRQAWKGMVCRDCGRCNSRTKWDEWKCETEGCSFEVPIQYTAIPLSELTPDHAFEAEGHSIPFDKYEAPVVRTESSFHGYWRKMTYELFPGNFISHYISNRVINRQPGGADEMLQTLQGVKLGMQRFPLETSPVEGDMITKHFGMNFGLPYKYVVAIDSRAFSEAPSVIIDALNHLTWAGQDAIKDGSYRPFNELLCLAYMEKQAIGWHDDGEKDLGQDIASLSLGSAATMNFRMKTKHWVAKKDTETRKKNAPVTLSLELRHGDMVVMHGARIQQVYEHGVQPKGKLRYGLTGRYIIPENIPAEEHWKGGFTIPPDKVYDGDLALFKTHHPEEEEDE